MHLLVRETHGLDEGEAAVDLGQTPGDLLFLSFSDSDLGAVAAAWQSLPEPKPSLRLANLVRLKHPMSVDIYVEEVVTRARCVVVRLLGGLDYWRYGAEEIAACCEAPGHPVRPGPGRWPAGPGAGRAFDDGAGAARTDGRAACAGRPGKSPSGAAPGRPCGGAGAG